MSPRMAGHISAPPTPISARQAMSSPTSGTTPHSSEKKAKIEAPTMNMRLRPSMSASRPPVTISTPNSSAYPLITHWARLSVVCRSCSIRGIATLSAVKSLAITKTPSPMAASASQVRAVIALSGRVVDTASVSPCGEPGAVPALPPDVPAWRHGETAG